MFEGFFLLGIKSNLLFTFLVNKLLCLDNTQKNKEESLNKNYGFIYATLGYILWGILPIYWRQLKGIPAIDLLSFRILLSFITLGLFIFITKKLRAYMSAFNDLDTLKKIALSTIALSFNWGSYTYAMVSDKVVEASLAYYISPLLLACAGVLFFKERLSIGSKLGIILAIIGVLTLTIISGVIPIWGIIIAVTFAIYGSIKKQINLDSTVSLLLELTFMMPFIASYLIFGDVATSSIANNQWFFLLFLGVATTLPLVLFIKGAKMIKMMELAVLQYIYPSLILIIGAIIYKEPFTRGHATGFLFIWTGIILSLISLKKERSLKS